MSPKSDLNLPGLSSFSNGCHSLYTPISVTNQRLKLTISRFALAPSVNKTLISKDKFQDRGTVETSLADDVNVVLSR